MSLLLFRLFQNKSLGKSDFDQYFSLTSCGLSIFLCDFYVIFREIAGKTGKYGETAGNSRAGELADLVDFESPMLSILKLQSQLKRLGISGFL